VEVRGLTGKEIRALAADGYPISRLTMDMMALAKDLDLAEKTMDAVLALVLTPEELETIDEQPSNMALDVWSAVLKETFGARGEEKNS
jgi:hypothetical protein